MHFTDFSRGLIGAFAIVGAGLPVAVGAAFSAKLQGEDRVALTFFGDGATNIGTFHEALNMAAVWKAPVVFIIENNLYGEYTPRARDDADRRPRRACEGLRHARRHRRRPGHRRRARGRQAAVARARAGDGPTCSR